MSNKEWALSAQKTCHKYYCGLGVFASRMWVSKQPSNPTSFIYIYIHYYIINRNKFISSSRPKKYINIFKKTLFSRNETFSTLTFLLSSLFISYFHFSLSPSFSQKRQQIKIPNHIQQILRTIKMLPILMQWSWLILSWC